MGGGGYLGVEFFFLLSGAFLGQSLKKDKEKHAIESWNETIDAAKKDLSHRFLKIFPYLFVSTIIEFTVFTIAKKPGVKEFSTWVVNLPVRLFVLMSYGFSANFSGVLWFLSSLFFAIWLIYPIIRRHYDVFTSYFAPMIALLIIGYFLKTWGRVERWNTSEGLLRAVATVSLGTFAFHVSERIRAVKLTNLGRYAITAIEALGWLAIFVNIVVIGNRELDGIAVLGMMLALSITLSGQSLLNGKFDSRVSMFLGRLSMVLYLNHQYWYESGMLSIFKITESTLKGFSILLCLSLLASIVVLFLGDKLRVWARKAKPLLIATPREDGEAVEASRNSSNQ